MKSRLCEDPEQPRVERRQLRSEEHLNTSPTRAPTMMEGDGGGAAAAQMLVGLRWANCTSQGQGNAAIQLQSPALIVYPSMYHGNVIRHRLRRQHHARSVMHTGRICSHNPARTLGRCFAIACDRRASHCDSTDRTVPPLLW